jgi:hypothetical protein
MEQVRKELLSSLSKKVGSVGKIAKCCLLRVAVSLLRLPHCTGRRLGSDVAQLGGTKRGEK